MDAPSNLGLLHFLDEVLDPRSRHGRQHPLSAVLALACCAIMCGSRSYAAIGQWAHDQDIAFMHRLGFTRRPPKSGGIRKVLMALSPAALEAALTRWAEALLGQIPAEDEGLLAPFALDGKSVRGSFDGLNKAVHLLSLVAHRSGLTVAQAKVPDGAKDKTNEHKAALQLLSGLVLEGRLITGDAIFCQRDLSRQIVDSGGHYLWVVKDNQPALPADIRAAFAPGAVEALSPPAAAPLA
ncbi:ISAs1 family transposase [Singulisphaera sp. PoT]|uniref:ISAs1 family transposase n=1 Tax=Singulisphaera sp. PoT TaxID=3411797 RepID=UPI003BF61C6D